MNPTSEGLYLGKFHKCGDWNVLRWAGDGEWDGWQYQNNPINIARKYDQHVCEWRDLPMVKDRSEQDPPADGALCVVHLLGERADDHGLAVATYDAKNMTFKFIPAYDGWTKDYDDWQFDGFGIIA